MTQSNRSAAAILAATLCAAASASAQTAPGPYVGVPEEFSPASELSSATIGSDFSVFRNAIAARRTSLGRPLASQDSNALSGGAAPGWNGINSAWGTLDTKFLGGTYSGNSTSLIFGADTLVGSSSILGIIAGYNRSSVDLPSGEKIQADGFSIGPYFSAQLSDTLSLDGFIAYGRPDYDVDGGDFSGEKLFGNLTLTGYVPLSRAELYPFISVAAARENLPGFTATNTGTVYAPTKIKGLVGTIGTSVSYAPIERGDYLYLPRAGIELDFVRNDDGFGNKDSFQTLRINGGVSIIGDAGGWSLGADIGRTSEGTTTVGANATYVLQF